MSELAEPVETEEEDPALDEAEAAELINRFRREVFKQATPIESLLAKMDAWLLQQPEFIALLMAPRATRRQAAKQLAHHITTYPMRGRNFGGYLD